MTLSADMFVFSYLKPKIDEETKRWNGCDMRRITSGSLGDTKEGVQYFAIWINEIHQWDLTVHAHGCQEDIEILLAAKGIPTSPLMSAQG